MAGRIPIGSWSSSIGGSRRGIDDRRRRPVAPARGPRRRPRPAARSVSRRPRVRAGDARPGTRLRRLARSARSPGRAGAPRRSPRATAWRSTRSRCGCSGRSAARCPPEPPDTGTGINNVSVVLLGADRRAPVPAGRRRGAGRRPIAADRGPAARRPPQGRPSRQPDRDDRGVRRGGPAPGRGRVRGNRQPVRPPGAAHARTAGRIGRPRVPDRRDGTVTVTFDASGTLVKTRPRREGSIDSRLATAGSPLSPVAARLAADARGRSSVGRSYAAYPPPQRSGCRTVAQRRRPDERQAERPSTRWSGRSADSRSRCRSDIGSRRISRVDRTAAPARRRDLMPAQAPQPPADPAGDPGHILARRPLSGRSLGLGCQPLRVHPFRGPFAHLTELAQVRWPRRGRIHVAPARTVALAFPSPSMLLRRRVKGYHRVDDRPRARGCRRPAALPRSAGLVRAPRARRGRGRRLAGGADRGATGSPSTEPAVEAAALLHDVDKLASRERPGARPAVTAHGSAAWLTRRGHPELARPSRTTRSPGSPTGRRTDAGRRSRAARSGSSPTPTSAPASGWSRWTPGSRRGAGATRTRWDAPTMRAVRAPGRPARGGRLPGGRHRSRRRPATGVDRPRPSARQARRPIDRSMISPAALRLGRRRAGRRAPRRPLRGGPRRPSSGAPLERWDLRADLATAATGRRPAPRAARDAVMFGGGTLAVVANPGALVRRNDTRDRVIEAIGLLARRATRSSSSRPRSRTPRVPAPQRLADAVKAAGGAIRVGDGPAADGARRLDRGRGPRSRPAPGARAPRASWPIGSAPGDRGRRRPPLPEPHRVGRARQAGAPPRHRRWPGHRRRRAGARRRDDAGLGLGPDRRRRRATGRARRWPRSTGCSTTTPGAGPAGRPPSADRRAARARRSAGGGDGTAGRGPGDGHHQRVPGEDAGRPGPALDDRRADAALDGLVELDAMVKGAPGSRRTRRSADWRSRCGSRSHARTAAAGAAAGPG